MSRTVRLKLHASAGQPCRVYFEPEGAETVLADDDWLEIEIVGGDETGLTEITYLPEGIMVWVPSRAHTRVWDSAGARIPV